MSTTLENQESQNETTKTSYPLGLPYNLETLPREKRKYYIGPDQEEIEAMLKELKLTSLEELFSHISDDVKFKTAPQFETGYSYENLKAHVEELSKRNRVCTNFIGDGLKDFKPHNIIGDICNIRGLTTAYTPYQPERSQGTLYTLWFYSSCMKELTGFEGINASLYERSTCLYEALHTAKRLLRKTQTKALIVGAIYPGDKEVLETLSEQTQLEVEFFPVDSKTGVVDIDSLKDHLERNNDYCALAFNQINHLGLHEQVHELTDLATAHKIKSIAIIDPIMSATGGLLPPSQFGSEGQGVDIIVGEAQHLALDLNYGGPGLGLFGIRYNDNDRISIRSTPGRYVGKAKDQSGQDCLTMVLSTREQHIRRDKATSNICSNQSFVATLAGANMLALGDQGMSEKIKRAKENCQTFLEKALSLEGIDLAFENTNFWNEVTLKLDLRDSNDLDELILKASEQGLHIGVNVTNRTQTEKPLLLISFYEHHSKEDIENLITFLKDSFQNESKTDFNLQFDKEYLRTDSPTIPQIERDELLNFYQKLGELNFSPDDNVYPLGSCTMKYNPYINDYAAGLKGFQKIHPQAPLKDVQGNLEILYKTQEEFKAITGLPGVTTQPVAGAQGELVGLKLFQAYHKENSKTQRDMILIPRSAHGTNPATATVAGFVSGKTEQGRPTGIITINANSEGQMDLEQIKDIASQYGDHICGIMVTNPNTSGIFENNFKAMADIIHEVGGFVYMDGANMNAIAGFVDLGKLGVDAVHNNLHKTWTIPHGGGGPGDAIVAVSEKLIPYLPGIQVLRTESGYELQKPEKSIGSFHRHFGNFAHKVRSYTYIRALGPEGVRQMSAIAVLCSQYLLKQAKKYYPTLPEGTEKTERMHEFIITLSKEMFDKLATVGIPKTKAMGQVGKVFLDFGLHAPTVAFPEPLGMMIEPTESFTKDELDRFVDVLKSIAKLILEHPDIVAKAPLRTPILKVQEVEANKKPVLFEKILELPKIPNAQWQPQEMMKQSVEEIFNDIRKSN
ncbi:MAG: aminomethyl-transferring glycine dehydrogenase subunit GcvPB [Bacteriovoracaceae bacterium]